MPDAFNTTAQPAQNPDSWFSPSVVDMGVLPLRGLGQADFIRRQVSPAGPAIRSVTTGCGCTSPSWSQDKIFVQYVAPAELPEWHRHAGHTVYHAEQAITIYFDDNTTQTLRITARVTA